MSGIINPADIGTRTTNVDQLLKQPDNEWPEQANLEFASGEQNEQKAFISSGDKSFSGDNLGDNFNRLLYTMAYVQLVFNKQKPAV